MKFQLRDMDALYRQRGAATAEALGTSVSCPLLTVDQIAEVDHVKQHDMDIMCTPGTHPVQALVDYGIQGMKMLLLL